MKNIILKTLFGFWLLFMVNSTTLAQPFTHPGLLQCNDDLARIKKAVEEKQEPIYSGYLVFQANPQSKSSYIMQGPLPMVSRKPTVGQGTYDTDAAAAYQNAIMWAITGQKEYADKAKEIINAWSVHLKQITGQDAVLMAGLGPFKMINAAEILRYTNSGWSKSDIEKTELHFKQVIYPVIKDYAPFANGNWDSAAMKTAMSIGVFCNDRAIFEKALRYYVDGAGDGSLFHYIINETGQCQESGRDQAHTQLGIAHLGDCAEIAWHQGLDLYSYGNNRLLKGFEYTAQYNLGLEVPYVVQLDQTGKYLNKKISPESRGRFRTIYEEIYNHYVNRAGLIAPYTRQVVEKTRPEQQGSGGDNVGFGTLLFTRQLETAAQEAQHPPAAPGGLIAKTSSDGHITITWINSKDAKNYAVKRSVNKNGPFVLLAKNLIQPTFSDRLKTGVNYFYTVSASNDRGQSVDSYSVSITAGLPLGWSQTTIGPVVKPTYMAFDGSRFTLEGTGDTVGGSKEHFPLVYKRMNGNSSMVARYVPQLSFQGSIIGLTMRSELNDNAAEVSLILVPQSHTITEEPQWEVRLFGGSSRDHSTVIGGSAPMQSTAIVTYGRLTGHCWFRLERHDDKYLGYFSENGNDWIKVGAINCLLAKKYYAGLLTSSGNPSIGNRVNFDKVMVKKIP